MENLRAQKVRYKRENGTYGVRTVHVGESLTQQQFKDDQDVNIIMAKFAKTKDPRVLKLRDAGVYIDLVDAPDYQESMQAIINAQNAFAAIPAEVRLEKFNNDPSKMIKFLKDPKNDDEAIKLGLKVKRPVEKNPVLDELKELNKTLKAPNSGPKTKKSSPSTDD